MELSNRGFDIIFQESASPPGESTIETSIELRFRAEPFQRRQLQRLASPVPNRSSHPQTYPLLLCFPINPHFPVHSHSLLALYVARLMACPSQLLEGKELSWRYQQVIDIFIRMRDHRKSVNTKRRNGRNRGRSE